MKLYSNNGQVYFDYTDVDTNAELNSKTLNWRRFMWEVFGYLKDEPSHVLQLTFKPYAWANEYSNQQHFKSLLRFWKVQAKNNGIEVDESVIELSEQVKKLCEELRAIEVAKEEQRKAETKWQDVCKYGCGYCEHKRKWNDDDICAATGETLPTKTVPTPYGKVVQLFNNKPFPTENCPFNINKNKETNNVQESTKKAS